MWRHQGKIGLRFEGNFYRGDGLGFRNFYDHGAGQHGTQFREFIMWVISKQRMRLKRLYDQYAPVKNAAFPHDSAIPRCQSYKYVVPDDFNVGKNEQCADTPPRLHFIRVALAASPSA